MSLTFWKPGTTGPGSSLDRASIAEGNFIPSAPIHTQRTQLPIFRHKLKLLHAVEQYGVVIVVGQTGCGKTTQVPQYLYEAGWAADGHVIGCTQPRRVAATSVASRVAAEVGTPLGAEVGYTIRFEDVSDKERTRILYLTDGMLFRETLSDPLLSRYSVVMIDEAHERSVHTDLLLGVLKKIRKKRPSFRIIVSSATLDATKFRDYFTSDCGLNEATVVGLEGRAYPVDIAYLNEPIPDYVQKAAHVAADINAHHGRGDILIFLPGRDEIDRCIETLQEIIPTIPPHLPQLQVMPLHSGISLDEQMHIFEPAEPKHRKVIISTNIAEASVTIDRIKFVIDSGFVKIRTYNATTGITSLSTVPTSAASAIQRAGRAGRTSAGFCYRLYTNTHFRSLPPSETPEITRINLATPILQLKALGINDLTKFGWISAPPAENIIRALEFLSATNIIDQAGQLTTIGEHISECPVDLRIAQLLFKSTEYNCGEEILSIAAIISVQNIFISSNSIASLAELEHRKFVAEEGDFFTLLNAFNAFQTYGKSAKWCKAHFLSFKALSRALSIKMQLKKYMQKFNLPCQSCQGNIQQLAKCITSVLWQHCAQWIADGNYKGISGQIYSVHPTSIFFTRKPKSGWVIFYELEQTKKLQINILQEITPEWLTEFSL